MHKKLTIILLILMFFPAGLSARKREDVPFRHEWRFGLAGYPLGDMLMYSRPYYDYYYPYDSGNPDYIYQDFEGARRMTGLLSAEYSINCRRRFTFAIGGYLSSVWHKKYDYTGAKKGTGMGVNLTLMPTARFRYIDKDIFGMYGSIAAGIMVGYFEQEFYAFPTFQIVPVGITIGKKVYGFAEAGVGLLYIGGNIGVGYRF